MSTNSQHDQFKVQSLKCDSACVVFVDEHVVVRRGCSSSVKDDRRGLVIIFAYAFAYEGSLPTGVRPLEMSWNFLLFSSVGIPGH